MKTTDDSLIGLIIMELLETHWDKCDQAAVPSVCQEGYDSEDFFTIENIGGDNAHIRLVTTGGKEFHIVVKEVVGSRA